MPGPAASRWTYSRRTSGLPPANQTSSPRPLRSAPASTSLCNTEEAHHAHNAHPRPGRPAVRPRRLARVPFHQVDADAGCSCKLGPECRQPGKHPRTPSGFHTATTNPDRLRAWCPPAARQHRHRHSRASGMVGVDLDGPTGRATWHGLRRYPAPGRSTKPGSPPRVLPASLPGRAWDRGRRGRVAGRGLTAARRRRGLVGAVPP
ncbi:MAG: hypothetical protein GEU81_16235 [Nitriliruptorales bacterium]|nr:hypothetical protein [Nitriliruptorales bacterium]